MNKSALVLFVLYLSSTSSLFSQSGQDFSSIIPSWKSAVAYEDAHSFEANNSDEIALILIIGEEGYLFKNLENKEFEGQLSPEHIAGMHVIASPEQSINVIGFEKKAIAIFLDEASAVQIDAKFKLNKRQLKSVLADLAGDRSTI